jgi:hypothetical protein
LLWIVEGRCGLRVDLRLLLRLRKLVLLKESGIEVGGHDWILGETIGHIQRKKRLDRGETTGRVAQGRKE